MGNLRQRLNHTFSDYLMHEVVAKFCTNGSSFTFTKKKTVISITPEDVDLDGRVIDRELLPQILGLLGIELRPKVDQGADYSNLAAKE